MRKYISKIAAGLAAIVSLSGCGEVFRVAQDRDEHDVQVRNGAHYESVAGTGELSVFGPIEEVNSEENALRAFHKAKNSIWRGYFAYDDSEARGNYAQAADLFEKSLSFYILDLKEMTLGKNPVHQSANWDFLKGLHDEWARASVLAGRTICTDKIEENSKDAWALMVLYQMSIGRSEKEREQLISERFNEVKQGLVSQLEKTENSMVLNRPVSQRINAEITYTLPAVGNRYDEIVRGNGKGESLSERYDLKRDSLMKNNAKFEAQRLDRIRSASNLNNQRFLMGDSLNGRTYSVKVGN